MDFDAARLCLPRLSMAWRLLSWRNRRCGLLVLLLWSLVGGWSSRPAAAQSAESAPAETRAPEQDGAPEQDEATEQDGATEQDAGAPAGEIAAAQAPEGDHRYWTTDWSFRSIDAATLLRRLRTIGVEIPVEAEGDFSVAFSVSIPLDALRDGRAYRFEGSLTSSELQIDQLMLRNFAAHIRYANGRLDLQRLSTQLSGATGATPTGRLAGQASAQLQPRGDASASLTADSLAVAPIFDLVMSASGQPEPARLQGVVDGAVSFSAPVEAIGQPARWDAEADLQVRQLAIDGLPPLSVETGPLTIRDGRFQAAKIQMTSPAASDVRLAATADVELTGRQQFEASVRGNDVPLQSLASLAMLEASSVVTGKLDLDARGTGTLADRNWDVDARLASPQLLVFGLDFGLLEHRFEFDSQQLSLNPLVDQPSAAVKLRRIEADYELTPAAVTLSQVSAEVFGGTVQGNALLPRSAGEPVRVDFSWQGIRPEIRTGPFSPVDTVITAETSGQIDWTAPAGALERPGRHRGEAEIHLSEIAVGDAPVGELQLRLAADEGTLLLAGDGNLFGGQVRVETSRRLAADTRWSELAGTPGGTEVTIDAAQLAQIARIGGRAAQRRWGGTVSGQIDWGDAGTPAEERASPAGEPGIRPAGIGLQLTAQNVTVNRRVLTPRLALQLRLVDGVVWVDRVDGSYAGGGVQATGRWSLAGGVQRLQVRAWNLDAERAVLPLSPDGQPWARGGLSGRMTLAGGERLRLRGSLDVRQAEVASVPLGTTHGGFSGSIAPASGRWQLDFHRVRGRLGGGRLIGEAHLSSAYRGGGYDLDSWWRADRVDFTTLMTDVGQTPSFAEGSITGDLELGGRAISSFGDLEGRFDWALGGTEARAVPGLPRVQNYLTGVSLAGVRFDQGRARGDIGGGTMRFNELWLSGERARVWADGSVWLDSGRLDMNAAVATGNFEAQNAALLLLAEQLALQGAWPVVALVQVNQWLSDRTVVVDLWGTVDDPRVRLRTLESMRRSAARFFLRQATGQLSPLGENQRWVQPRFFRAPGR